MFVTEPTEPITRIIKPGDPNFLINNGIMLTPRAGIDILPNCPTRYANMLAELYSAKWFTPFAVVTSEEYTWMTLRRK